MRTFSGSGGRLFLASDSLAFRCALTDVGGGWTFADREGSWWVDGSTRFSVDGEWVAADAVFPLAGRVSFTRCLRGRAVVAEGDCYPTVCAVAAAAWELRVSVPIGDTTGLTDEVRSYGPVPGRTASASLSGCRVESWLAGSVAGARVLAQLPFQSGLIVGVGVASFAVADTSTVLIDFDEGDVTYVC